MAGFPLMRQTKAEMLCREATTKQESHADHPFLVPVALLLRVTSVSVCSVSQPRSRPWNTRWGCNLEDANHHLHLPRKGRRYWNHEKHGVVIFTIISRHNCSRQLPPDDDTFDISRLSLPPNVPQQFPLIRIVRIKVNVLGLSTIAPPAILRGRPVEYQIWTRCTAEQRHWSWTADYQKGTRIRHTALVSQAKRLAQQEAVSLWHITRTMFRRKKTKLKKLKKKNSKSQTQDAQNVQRKRRRDLSRRPTGPS
ncbi:hypothetical protein BDP67DRAFT_81802 [Colletotrichum lupini]|nr:hypothetical protein BDP67DRAFT_81802 [Colletotrichum lupini]